MNFVEVIAKKRDGGVLTGEEIRSFVRGATDGSLGDEQLAAMLMAICIRGASADETSRLVEQMRDSGARWELRSSYPGIVDKHSTGGVGDTVSLVFAPLVAACGVPVAMMAGAGLGHTQGTLDKLAAVPGFAVASTREEALARVERCGVCFAAQSAEIAPADRKLYLLRDVTATVPSLPLIVASIMSKKLAVGAGRLVLDVKCGSGAFCKTLDEAMVLAEGLEAVAAHAGVACAVLVTDMDEPLGHRLGCANEVRAALDILEGRGDGRLAALSASLAVEALCLSDRTRDAATAEVEAALRSGAARRAWDTIVRGHGGDPDPSHLASPSGNVVVTATRAGFVASIDGESLGWLAVALGAGRLHQGDEVDFGAGVATHVGVGDRVLAGDPMVTLELGGRAVDVEALAARARAAFTIAAEPPAPRPLVLKRLGAA